VAVDIQMRAQSVSSASDPSQFVDLDTQTQRGSYRGLAVAASIYAAGYFLAFTSGWITEIVAGRRFFVPEMFDNVVAIVSIGYAVFTVYKSRGKHCQACQFTAIALSFLVLSSAGIGANFWGWEQQHQNVNPGVSWVGVWLVAFPAVVTLPPRRLLLGALLSCFVTIGIAVVSLLVHGTPEGFLGSPWLPIARLAIPILICAGMAWAISYRVFSLARDVSKARKLGSYQLSEKIGSGGMGEVWKAKHRFLARPAAVKLIRPEAMTTSSDGSTARALLRRFEREAQVTAQLTSPHSITLYDFGTADDGAFYYVMELLDGRDLKTLVREHGPVPAERAVHFLRQACDSLADAHDRGLIHRDIKPANIFACRRGRDLDFTKVLDFGLVKKMREDGGDMLSQLSATGITSGTPGFMAPEMVTGESEIDARADLYALGCVAYWLVSGQLVFEGNTPMAMLIQHVKETPPPLSSRTELNIPASLERLIMACLAKNPANRPASAELVGEELAAIAAELPPWTRDRAEKWWRTNVPILFAPAVTAAAVEHDTGASTVINV
jgi:eukaryotic-like serine/threonine-protein kinase